MFGSGIFYLLKFIETKAPFNLAIEATVATCICNIWLDQLNHDFSIVIYK